ncbi:MAG: hypothetical protein NTV05_10380 [Acidobacteria bacterium]|nr:hypothetical protein [Acidobacteriota bacterium]
MTTPSAPGTSTSARRLPGWIAALRATLELAALLAAAAFGLRVLDQLPGMAAGVDRGVRRVDSVVALERQLSHKLPIPAYFPDTLMWPPHDLLIFEGTSASMSFRHRQRGDTWLIVGLAVDARGIAPEILPPASSLQTENTVVRGVPARVDRLRDRDGVMWYQLTWQASGVALLARYRGTLDEIMLIANSMDERGR